MCRPRLFVVLVVLCATGCGKPSTDQLIDNLKSPEALTRLKAVRTLPQRQGDAERVVPALVAALRDEDAEVRRAAAFGLGALGEQARGAAGALRAALRDRAPAVRKAAHVALSHIDPGRVPKAAPPART